MVEQRVLSKEQLSDFYIEEFVGEQKAHISRLLKSDSPDLKVVDVGGGVVAVGVVVCGDAFNMLLSCR